MLKDILRKLVKGEVTIKEAENLIKLNALDEINNIAKIDVNRELRSGIPEIIYGKGKTEEQIIKIVIEVLKKKDLVIISKAEKLDINKIKDKIKNIKIKTCELAGLISIRKSEKKIVKLNRNIGIITGGTADIPIAEEARFILEELGCNVITVYDVGVAGVHRVFPSLKKMIENNVDVIIVVAGREGALPTVISGLIDIPIIAVPVSSGYGIGGDGTAALLSMLQSCSLGLAVVNINNGVGAAAVAYLIAKRVAEAFNTLRD